MSARAFYHFYPQGLNPCTLERDASGNDSPEWLCPGCNAPRPGVTSVDVQIQERRPGSGPLACLIAGGILLARRDWLEMLGLGRTKEDLFLGSVRGDGGRILRDWSTVRARHSVIVRGSKNAGYRKCDVCGRIVYFAMGVKYLCPAPAEDAYVFESYACSLVIDAKVVDRSTLEPSRKLGINKLAVLSTPQDGLTEIL
jgi:hypothetical protein